MELTDELHDSECDSVIKKYQRRPKSLENICLAEFTAWYNYVKEKNSDDTTFEDPFQENADEDIQGNDDTNIGNEPPLRSKMNFVQRKKARVIRFLR